MRRSESGFSLIELLIAMSILAVGLLATVTMQVTALQRDGFAQRTTEAAALSRGAMDDLMSRPGGDVFFQTAVAAPGIAFDLDPNTAATTQTIQGATYSATVIVTPNASVSVGGAAPVSVLNLTQVILTVTGGGRTATVTEFKRAVGT
jgi:type IV pilus assembly protein PilV